MTDTRWLKVAGAILMVVTTTLAAQATDEREMRLSGFGENQPQLDWRVVNDNVMGGRSDGDFITRGATLIFTGSTNTNGGGFSSIRAEPLALDLAPFDGIRLRVKGDGRRYTWRLASTRRWRGIGVGYWAEFDTVADQWQTVDLPFTDFIAQVRGRRLEGPGVDRSQIAGMGLMIYDGRDGEFEIELEGVYAYATTVPALDDLRWNKRAVVLSSPTPDDPEFATQMALIRSTREQFDERDLVLVILHDDDDSAAATAARERLRIGRGAFSMRLVGKDGGVKSTHDAPVNMQDIYGLIDTMPMRQREMRDADR